MPLKTATVLAAVGMLVVAVLQTWLFVKTAMAVSEGAAAFDAVFPALVYAFAAITGTMFLFALMRTQN